MLRWTPVHDSKSEGKKRWSIEAWSSTEQKANWEGSITQNKAELLDDEVKKDDG